MLRAALVVMAGISAFGQAMSEAAAAMAGSTVGAAAGKQVSRSIDNIFRKVDTQLGKAAGVPAPPKAPPLEVGEGAPTPRVYSVPDPPPTKRVRRVARPVEPAPVRVEPVAVEPPPPPPPPVTAEVLATVRPGMSREELFKLGAKGTRITMFDDGHLVEMIRYPGGSVRLTDGAVESVTTR